MQLTLKGEHENENCHGFSLRIYFYENVDLFSPESVLDLFDWRSLLRDILDQHQPISYILDLAC